MGSGSFVEFRLGSVRVGIPLRDVERVLRAVALAPVPGAPACLLGMLNLHGEPTPVYDTRRLLGLPTRDLQPGDRFVLTRAGTRRAAFVADEVAGTLDAGELQDPPDFSARAAGMRGVAMSPDGIVFVHDLTRFFYLERAIPVARHE
jgi:purine-binding chemotaxis protein CheW